MLAAGEGGSEREKSEVFLVRGRDAGSLCVDEVGGYDRVSRCMRGAIGVPRASLGGLVWMDWGRRGRRDGEGRYTCMRGR